ncbi:MAG: tyrosine-type recombinase/integrase [Alphaproteobacteria bacterium]|nr:tyrosine-type recombinase/integrase [Alphaproteobacteria bacterium]
MAKVKITKAYLDSLGPGEDRTVWDEAVPRFGVRVRASGKRFFFVQYRDAAGRTRKVTLGEYAGNRDAAGHTIDAARKWARQQLGKVDSGSDPAADRDERREPAKTVAGVLEDFTARYLRAPGRGLRSAKEYETTFNRLVKPAIGTIGIYELRRGRVVSLLDAIEDENGPVMADRTLAYLRKALNWYATRDDRFTPPIVKGMARTRPKEIARDRVLAPDEIREIWPHLSGTWGAFVKTLLFTAQRRSEVAGMSWSEIDEAGVWVIPAERYKTGVANVVPLSEEALTIIRAQPKVSGSDFVFASRAGTALPASGKPKATLDRAVDAARAKSAGPMPNWRLHDLRRTAKTLMASAGVRPDISERVLGHVIAGVEGVYDRYSYANEKRDALERLASEINRILSPFPKNVVSLGKRQAARVAAG